MNKKKLQAQVDELYNIVKETEALNASLKKRIDELMIIMGAKDFEIGELKKQVESLEQEKAQKKHVYYMAKETVAMEETSEEPVEEPAEEVIEEAVETAEAIEEIEVGEAPVKYITNDSLEDEISKYAAKAISNISLKAAMLSNLLAASGSPNAKDLLTLTLGRSEVFKQRVFEATKLGAEIDTIKANINLLEAETLEYFEQLKAQL